MKDTSAGVLPKFLLVVATLLAGTSAPPPRAAQPKAQSAQGATSSKAFMRVTVGQGEVRREPFVLTSDCLPHLISLRSEADFFRFEQPTESVLVGRDRPVTLNALVDATRLKPKLYSFTVTVKCLNCGSVKCNHRVTRLPIEVEVVKPSESPTPTPTSEAELEELSKNGPAIPDTFPLNDLKFRALFRWGWSVRLVFELAQPGVVTLTVYPDGYDRPLVYEGRGLTAGVHEKSFALPDAARVRRPDATGAATYSVRAVTEGTPAEGVEPFFLRSLAAGGAGAGAPRGDRVAAPMGDYAPPGGARLTDASYGLAGAWGRAAAPLGIEEVTFAPRDVRVVGDRPTANAPYSFRATLPFNGGAKAVVRLVNGGSSTAVSGQSFGRLEAGQTVNGAWDCLKEGAPSLGRHRLMVRAWYTVQSGGDYEFDHSADSVLVRR
ncbi:MAG TPA: hypothetical protein VF591_25845 [Pyrinomonadaceae bacterium]|jgi:hypothetical protein